MFAGDILLQGKVRVLMGKKVKQLRKEGEIPGNVSGDVDKPIAVQLNKRDFEKVYLEAGDTSVISLKIETEEKNRPVMVESVEIHPTKQSILHVSFRQVNLKEKISTSVPIELISELGIKEATPVLLRENIEVEALPNNLPESFEIDLSTFNQIGQELKISQLPYDHNKVEILEDDLEQVILQIQELKQMDEVVEEVVIVPEVETPADAKNDTVGAGEKKE